MALLVTESWLRLVEICRASSGLSLTSKLRSSLASELCSCLTSKLVTWLTSELTSGLRTGLRGSLVLAILTPVGTALDTASINVGRVSGTHADAGLHRSSGTLTGQLRIKGS